MKRAKSHSGAKDTNPNKAPSFISDANQLSDLLRDRDRLDQEIERVCGRESFRSTRSNGQRFPMRRWDSR